MKITNAFWEKRNLGVETVEITLERGDALPDLRSALNQFACNYTVLKVPSSNSEFLFELNKQGFFFIETMFQCHHAGGDFGFNPIQQRIMQKAQNWVMNAGEVENLLREIQKGMFSTDRISVDPHFGSEIANKRYSYWIRDEIEKGAFVHNVAVDGKNIGFFALKKVGGGNWFLFLAGLYLEYQSTGLGFCTHFRGIQEGLNSGARRVLLSYSSNNRGAAGLHMGMGHKLDEVFHVFIRHQPS
jgi:hypothetical protein